MTTCLGKSSPFGLPRVPFVNCCQFMYLVNSLLVLRAGMGSDGTSTAHCLSFYFHISYVQYLAVMSSKFIICLSQSANQINGYGFSTFLYLPMRVPFT